MSEPLLLACPQPDAKPAHPHRRRSMRHIIKQAEKAGKRVSSVTTPEGYIVNFVDLAPAVSNGSSIDNPWDGIAR